MHLVFYELQDVQELIQNVPRQNFGDIIKWKLFEFTLNKGISIATIKPIWDIIFPNTQFPYPK